MLHSLFADSWFARLQLKQRSEESELMDAAGITHEMLALSYRELAVTHRWLGNTAAVMKLLREDPLAVRSVLDIGCGQGALLMEIQRRFGVRVVGLELRPAPQDAVVPILTGNAVKDPLPEADVAISVAVAHHLSDAELVGMIRNVARSSRRLILLDLVRHPVPLALFRAFVCPLLSKINAEDGQTSIRRAYTRKEMRVIVEQALAGVDRPVMHVRHTVAALWTRQIVDIGFAP